MDFERRIGLGQGGLHGLVQDLAHTTVFRPSTRSTCIDGLYLAGSSTNPGGGVPPVIPSGTITASSSTASKRDTTLSTRRYSLIVTAATALLVASYLAADPIRRRHFANIVRRGQHLLDR